MNECDARELCAAMNESFSFSFATAEVSGV